MYRLIRLDRISSTRVFASRNLGKGEEGEEEEERRGYEESGGKKEEELRRRKGGGGTSGEHLWLGLHPRVRPSRSDSTALPISTITLEEEKEE